MGFHSGTGQHRSEVLMQFCARPALRPQCRGLLVLGAIHLEKERCQSEQGGAQYFSLSLLSDPASLSGLWEGPFPSLYP